MRRSRRPSTNLESTTPNHATTTTASSTGTVLKLGTERHHAELLRGIDTMDAVGCFALTELGFGARAPGLDWTVLGACACGLGVDCWRTGRDACGESSFRRQDGGPAEKERGTDSLDPDPIKPNSNFKNQHAPNRQQRRRDADDGDVRRRGAGVCHPHADDARAGAPLLLDCDLWTGMCAADWAGLRRVLCMLGVRCAASRRRASVLRSAGRSANKLHDDHSRAPGRERNAPKFRPPPPKFRPASPLNLYQPIRFISDPPPPNPAP